MIRGHFDHYRPKTFDEAVALLDQCGSDVTVLGGGTMLVPSMTLGLRQVDKLLELSALGLNTIMLEDDALCIGALASYADVLKSPLITDKVPLLRAMAEVVTGGPSILNQATLGGSACFGNPASDVPACLVVLEAELELMSKAGSRRVSARTFFQGAFVTDRRSNEFLARIRIPLRECTQMVRYTKHKSCASSWPIVTVACVLSMGSSPKLTLSVGAAAEVPTFHSVPFAVLNLQLRDAWVDALAREASAEVGEGWSDELADAAYRRAIVPGAVRRVLRGLLQEIEG